MTRTLTVITREQIDVLPVHSIADVLRLVGSVDVRARGVRGVQTDFAVRGANFGQMLVLVDGVRMNDAQSGHHNGDIPVALDDVERIEILHGPGSALFGADAFGGTVNVITRRSVERPAVQVQGGSFGLASARGAGGLSGRTASADGGCGDRAIVRVHVRPRLRERHRSCPHLNRQPNERLGGIPAEGVRRQQLLRRQRAVTRVDEPDARGRRSPVRGRRGWTFSARGSYRTHGDRFVFNQLNPALSDNRHRTHAMLGEIAASRRAGTGTLTAGVETGGDWIRSSNLGDHDIGRVSAFGEWRQASRPPRAAGRRASY